MAGGPGSADRTLRPRRMGDAARRMQARTLRTSPRAGPTPRAEFAGLGHSLRRRFVRGGSHRRSQCALDRGDPFRYGLTAATFSEVASIPPGPPPGSALLPAVIGTLAFRAGTGRVDALAASEIPAIPLSTPAPGAAHR